MIYVARRSFALCIGALIACIFMFSPAVSAQQEAINDACSRAPNSPICKDLDSRVDPVQDSSNSRSLFVRIFNILSFVAGVAAVIMMVIAGIKMMTSDGDSAKFGNARNTIIYASIGLVIVASAQLIVQFVVLRLIQ